MGYPVSNPRKTVIGSLAVGLLIPIAALVLISRHARSGPEYLHALAFSTQAPEVVADLGEPIDDGPMPSIKWPLSTAKTTVNLNITLKGPNGKGDMALTEVHDEGGWQIVYACWTYGGASKKLAPEPAPHAP